MSNDTPLVLYRATVTPLADASSVQPSPLPEYFVFFEARRRLYSTKVLEALLHHAWAVDPSTLILTVCSERELVDDFSMGPASDGDVRLFEDGYDAQHIFYCDPDRTQFFVRPQTQLRLQAAQAVATQRRLELHARRAFDVARTASNRDWIARHAVGGAS